MASPWSSHPIGKPLGPFFGEEGTVVRVPWLDARIEVYWHAVQIEQFVGTPLWEPDTTVYAPGFLPAQVIQLETLDASPTLHSPIPYREGEIYAPLLDASPTIHGPSVAYDQAVEMPILQLFTEFYAPRVSPVGTVEIDPPTIPSGTLVYTPDVKGAIGPAFIAATTTLHQPTLSKAPAIVELSGKWGPLPMGVVGPPGQVYVPRISSISRVYTPTVGEIDPGTLWMDRIGPNTIVYRPSVWGEWGEPGDDDWPDAFMSYPPSGPISWNGVSNQTISHLSFEDLWRADGRPITLENCHNITIERIDTRGCTMGLVYALNCTNITIRYCRAENIAEEFAGQTLEWAGADAGLPGYFRNENDCNFYQFDKVDGFTVHDLKGRYGNMEDVFSHYSSSNGTVQRLHFEGGVSTTQPTTTGKPSVMWSSESGTGVILGDQLGHDVLVSDCTMVNCGQVLFQIAGGQDQGYDNCIAYGEGYTSQPWNVGVAAWGGSQPCTALHYTNMRAKYLKSDGSENGAWFDTRCDNIDTSGSDFSDDSLNIEDLRVHLEGGGPPPGPTDVLLTPGMSASQIDTAISGAGEYSEIGISNGTYYGFSIEPLNGQTFVGDGNVILDGQSSQPYAFGGGALYVTIRNVEVTNYANATQIGAITGMDQYDWYENPYQGPGGWTVEDCEVHHNAGAGITLEYDNATIRRCNIHHNRQIGFKLLWGSNQQCVDSEVSYNNYLVDYDWGWEAGGSKNWETANLYLARNYVHNNHGPGLWADHGNTGTIYEDNVIEDNYASGVFHEISYGCIIRGNEIRRNGNAQNPWLWGAAIQVANAGFAQIYDNTVEDNGNGICFTEQGRGYGPLSGEVYDNFVSSSGLTGVASDQTAWVQGEKWQWVLSTSSVDMVDGVKMYDIDGFEVDAGKVAEVHTTGAKAVGYLSTCYEEWRPDAGDFPESVKGNPISGWPGERWVDIREWSQLLPIYTARLQMLVDKGFDGVEWDMMDSYSNNSGFPLTAADQITFNVLLANLTHSFGLAVGLKNDVDQAMELEPYFDYAINEECLQYSECGGYSNFLAAGKPVYHCEYSDTIDNICASTPDGFSTIKKTLSLTNFVEYCPDDIPPDWIEGPFAFYNNTYSNQSFAYDGREMDMAEWQTYFPNDGSPVTPPPSGGWGDGVLFGNRPNQGSVIHLSGQSNVTISNLYFNNSNLDPNSPFIWRDGAASNAHVCISLENCSNIVIEYCDFEEVSQPIQCYNSDNITVRYNRSKGIVGPGARVNEQTGNFIQTHGGCDGVRIENTKVIATTAFPSNPYHWPSTDDQGNPMVMQTEDIFSFYGAVNSGMQWCQVDGTGYERDSGTGAILGDSLGSGNYVLDSTFKNPGQVGISIVGGYNHTMSGNLVWHESYSWMNNALVHYQYAGNPLGGCSITNNRTWYANGGHVWIGSQGDPAVILSGNTFGDGALSESDVEVVL